MTKVSVIIPTYNCAKYLPEALDSVLAQTYQDYEIVVVNDGSTDNTDSLIRPTLEKYPSKIRYFSQENKGLAATRNVAIGYSRGEYIALLDADDMFLPNRLEEGVRILDEKPDVGLVHANIQRIGEGGELLYVPLRDKRFLSGRIFEHIFLRKAHIAIPTILLRKSCFGRVGLFDENLTRLGCEDREMWLRVAREYQFYYIDKVLGLYRMRKGSMSNDAAKMHAARLYVVDKFVPKNSGCWMLRRKALSKIYKDFGDSMLLEQRWPEARQYYRHSLLCWPFNFWSWVNFMKAAFGIRPREV